MHTAGCPLSGLHSPFFFPPEINVTNNDILRRLRYVFSFNDTQMIQIFALASWEITTTDLHGWLKHEEEPGYVRCDDMSFNCFLNGLIIHRRGPKEGETPKPERAAITNNQIFRKLKIALDFRDEDILEAMTLADCKMSKHELSAFFRKPDHKNYRECKDQVLRYFLKGIQLKYRPGISETAASKATKQPLVAKKNSPWDSVKK